MVDAGFRSLPAPDAEPQPAGDYRPPAGWNGRFKDVWAFEYRRWALAQPSLPSSIDSIAKGAFLH